MREELRYDWLDVFRAPRIALSLQKIWIEFPPLFVGYLCYLCFTFLGFWVSGSEVLKDAWSGMGLVPCPSGLDVTVWGYLLWIVGLAILVGAGLFAGTAVARATYLELKGETFFTYRELYGFARKHAKNVLLGPLGIFTVVAGIVVCGLILGLLGSIVPAIGLVPVIGLSPLWFGISFFLVALVIVFVFSLLLAPAITATTRGDFFEVITETFSLSFSEPYRLVWYQGILLTIAMASVSVLGIVVRLGYRAMAGILSYSMGDVFTKVSTGAVELLGTWFPHVEPAVGATVRVGYFGWGFGELAPSMARVARTATLQSLTGWEEFWAYVFAIVLAFAGFLVVACYGMALMAAGNALIEIMRSRPDKRLRVLCGHTHSSCAVDVLENLSVVCGEAEYMEPTIQGVLNL